MNITKFTQFGIAMSVLTSFTYAAEVNFAGHTSGTFTPGGSSTLAGLSYVGSTFGESTTASGFLGLGGNAGTPNLNNLGSVSLTGQAWGYAGLSFTLMTTFTIPTGINETNPAVHTASLTGTVASSSSGGIFFDFNNNPTPFTFSSGNATGSFLFTVNDVSIYPGQTASVTGHITSASQTYREVPVPAQTGPDGGVTAALLGASVLGLGLMRRRIGA